MTKTWKMKRKRRRTRMRTRRTKLSPGDFFERTFAIFGENDSKSSDVPLLPFEEPTGSISRDSRFSRFT